MEEGIRIPLLDRSDRVRGATIIDAEVAPWVRQWTWRLRRSRGRPYAARQQQIDGTERVMFLHRELLGLPRNSHVIEADHMDGDGLNNRRANLRAVTHAQNQQNRHTWRGQHTSRYRGVFWHGRDRRWVAQVRLNGRKLCAGYFTEEEQAAEAAARLREQVMPFTVEVGGR